jgi:hypothetical protein
MPMSDSGKTVFITWDEAQELIEPRLNDIVEDLNKYGFIKARINKKISREKYFNNIKIVNGLQIIRLKTEEILKPPVYVKGHVLLPDWAWQSNLNTNTVTITEHSNQPSLKGVEVELATSIYCHNPTLPDRSGDFTLRVQIVDVEFLKDEVIRYGKEKEILALRSVSEMSIEERGEELQNDAEELAKKIRLETRRSPTKEAVVTKLWESDKYKECVSFEIIRRTIKKTWS